MTFQMAALPSSLLDQVYAALLLGTWDTPEVRYELLSFARSLGTLGQDLKPDNKLWLSVSVPLALIVPELLAAPWPKPLPEELRYHVRVSHTLDEILELQVPTRALAPQAAANASDAHLYPEGIVEKMLQVERELSERYPEPAVVAFRATPIDILRLKGHPDFKHNTSDLFGPGFGCGPHLHGFRLYEDGEAPPGLYVPMTAKEELDWCRHQQVLRIRDQVRSKALSDEGREAEADPDVRGTT